VFFWMLVPGGGEVTVWSLADDAVSSLYASLDDETAATSSVVVIPTVRCRCWPSTAVPADRCPVLPELRFDPGRRPLVRGRLLLIAMRLLPAVDAD